MLGSIFFLLLFLLSMMEFRIYLNEYFHFIKVGTRKKAKVVSSFSGLSRTLPIPIRSLPIVEIENSGKKIRLKTFESQYSPLTTFANIDKEVTVLVDENNSDYCMIDWKIIIIVGVIFNGGILTASLYLSGLWN